MKFPSIPIRRLYFGIMGSYLPIAISIITLSAHAASPDVSARIATGGIEVDSTVVLPVSPCQAYRMLTDYDELPGFVPGLLKSRATRISQNEVMVDQLGQVRVFLFDVKMESTLDMKETPDRRIRFRQVSGDFSSYVGEWDFSPAHGGTLVAYHARMTFGPYVPLALAKSVLDKDVTRKFEAIERAAVKSRDRLVCS
jgi:ribosome-associated toxin RatA of RatAB toxin-antitoxin module